MPSPLDDLGKLILRLAVGGLMLFHGVAKVTNGIDFVARMVAQAGWPPFFAYGVYVAELLAPALLILGILTRPAAMIIVLDMIAVVILARGDAITQLGQGGASWALEVEGFFFLGALAIACLGAGRIAVQKPGGLN